MPDQFLVYWKQQVAHDNIGIRSQLKHAASNELYRINLGDILWIITGVNGNLYLLGYLKVDRITDQKAAEKKFGNDLYESKYHAISDKSTQVLSFRKIPLAVVRKIRFISNINIKISIANRQIKPQQFQKMRKLTTKSGLVLRKFIEDSVGFKTPNKDYIEQSFTPSPDETDFDKKVKAALERGVIDKPKGQRRPKRVKINNNYSYYRDPLVKAWVLAFVNGKCEGCGKSAPFQTKEGNPYLEIHHVHSLANKGSDTIQNAVALCPNCHRRCHHSKDQNIFIRQLYKKVDRLVKE